MDRPSLTISFPPDANEGVETTSPTGSCPDPEGLLTVLADADSRTILAATADGPVAVSTIVEDCGISTPTAYRKVRQLVDLGLLDQEVRIRPTGTNYREFDLAVTRIDVQLDEGGTPAVSYVEREVDERDGDGRHDASDASSQADGSRFGDLFQDVTGQAELVEPQEPRDHVPLAEPAEIPLERDDGLSETLPDVESDSSY